MKQTFSSETECTNSSKKKKTTKQKEEETKCTKSWTYKYYVLRGSGWIMIVWKGYPAQSQDIFFYIIIIYLKCFCHLVVHTSNICTQFFNLGHSQTIFPLFEPFILGTYASAHNCRTSSSTTSTQAFKTKLENNRNI